MSAKYSKFDSFLMRILTAREYREVKAYEPCIITSTRDKHAFRFTFLTNERIYVTENPPKCLLYSVHLKDVVDMYMLNDKVKFLQADLKDHVQHIVVKYVSANSENMSANSSEHAKHPRAVRSVLLQQSHTTWYPGLIENTASSSTLQQTPPLLCSYAELGTVKSETLPSSHPLQVKQESASTFRAVNKTEKFKSEVRGRWEHRDPYPVHILRPDIEDNPLHNVEELHIYVLNENTIFLLMLRSVWRSYIIHSTKHCNDLEQASAEKFSAMDSSTRSLYSDLKQEVLIAKNVEHLYGLYHELKIAASRDVFIKFLFWNDDLVFKRSLDLITRYIGNSVSVNVQERADEMELLVLVLQTVAQVLREVEAIPQCHRILQNFGLQSFKGFINSMLCPPQLLCSSWQYHEDIKSNMLECTAAVCEVLYQLIVTSEQMTWIVYGKSLGFNATNLFATIGQNEHLRSFLDRLIEVCLNTWDPREKKSVKLKKFEEVCSIEPFTPEDAIKAFHLFTVLHRIIAKLVPAAQHVKTCFQEEFKWGI